MNKPYMKYVLGLAVLLVWGFFFKQLFENINGDVQVISHQRQFEIEETADFNDFGLDRNYRDPFLDEPLQSVQNRPTNQVVQKRSVIVDAASLVKKTKPKKVIFPKVKFKGYVKVDGAPRVALVEMDGQTKEWKLGAKEEGFLLNKITTDSITLYKSAQLQTYPLNMF